MNDLIGGKNVYIKYIKYSNELMDSLLSDEINRLIVYDGDGKKVEYFRRANSPFEQPERKTGKWILVTDNNGQHFVCDECGEWKYHQKQNFCGNCGKRMVEEGDDC